MKIYKMLFVGFIFVFLAGCTPASENPKVIADAYATTHEADRLDAQQYYDLRQMLVEDTIRNAKKQQVLDVMTAVKPTVIIVTKVVYVGVNSVLIAMIVYVLFSSRKAFVETTERVVLALAYKSEMQASLIKLDKVTRTFPVQLKMIDGQVYVLNHNSGAKFLLSGSENIPADAQMVSAFAQAVTSGVLAMEARKSKGKAGNASHFGTIDPTLITSAALVGELVES